MFSCPICRLLYTRDVVSREIKRVYATVHLKDKGDDVVHYILHPMETGIFTPLSEIDCDGCVSGKWASILCLLKQAWEAGDTDIYALKRMHPAPEFVLVNKDLQLPELDKITGAPINITGQKQLLIFRHIDIDELELLLNNK